MRFAPHMDVQISKELVEKYQPILEGQGFRQLSKINPNVFRPITGWKHYCRCKECEANLQ